MQLKNPANLLTNVKGISVPGVKLNPLTMEKDKKNTPVVDKDTKNTPVVDKAPVVEAVVKAANTAVNGNSKNAKKIASLLKNRNVINAAKKLVEELNHSAPSSPVGATPAAPPVGAAPAAPPVGATPAAPPSQKGGLRKTRSKAKKARSTRRR